MEFSQQLDQLMQLVHCSTSQLAEASGTPASTISRYHSGKRQPRPGSSQLEQIAAGIALLATQQGLAHPTLPEVRALLYGALEQSTRPEHELNSANINALIEHLGVNATEIARKLNYDASALSRIRSGKRRPSSPAALAASMAELAVRYCNTPESLQRLAELTGEQAAQEDAAALRESLEAWLLAPSPSTGRQVQEFLANLDSFDFDAFAKKVGYDALKVPQAPFSIPSSKTYCGRDGRKSAEIDFLKTLATGKSSQTFTLFCNMGMDELKQDEAFTKRFLIGMAATLKRGIRIQAIHTLDRPLSELVAGLQGWIPLYMTGQVSSFSFEGSTQPFQHMLYSSEAVALQGSCIADDLSGAHFALSTRKPEVQAAARQAQALLKQSKPLVQAYTRDRSEEFEEEQCQLLESGQDVCRIDEVQGVPLKNISVTVVGEQAAIISKRNSPRIDFILRDQRLCSVLRGMVLEGVEGSVWS